MYRERAPQFYVAPSEHSLRGRNTQDCRVRKRTTRDRFDLSKARSVAPPRRFHCWTRLTEVERLAAGHLRRRRRENRRKMKSGTGPRDLRKLTKNLHARLSSHIRKNHFCVTRLPEIITTPEPASPTGCHCQSAHFPKTFFRVYGPPTTMKPYHRLFRCRELTIQPSTRRSWPCR